jgi:translation initiation factor 3 subunit B
LRETTDVFEPPKMQEYPELENIWDWLVDDSGRDQLLAYKDFDISIVWAPNKNAAATVSNLDSNLIKHGKNLTDQFASWSPLGTYLCTAHRQGVLLWTGPSFDRFGKYAHTGVSKMFMSPNENYLVTCSREAVPFGQKAYNTFVWDVRTKQVLRGFNIDLLPNPDKTEEIDLANENWPWIKWSADESYLARLVNGFVMIYTLPNMEPFPLNIENVQDFEWSPAAATSGKSTVNVLALWTPEGPNAPARISLIDIPSKRMIRSKNIFSVKSVSICWKNL